MRVPFYSALTALTVISSLGFGGNCLGQKADSMQAANLGDGHGDSACAPLMKALCLLIGRRRE